jgi:methylated-DNA-[protein]-cysteine S-methyltransferase
LGGVFLNTIRIVPSKPPAHNSQLCYDFRVTETLHFTIYDSPVGPLTLVASDRGLFALEFGRHPRGVESPPQLAPYVAELSEYFAGRRREFTQPLDLRGTEFQLRCWRELLRIPYGQTRSYADLAHAVGSPRGFRAVGHANGRNPIAIIVPCHRVISSDGTLGGYGGGLRVKEELLRLEGARLF